MLPTQVLNVMHNDKYLANGRVAEYHHSQFGRMREAGLHIEVWSLTMRLPGTAQTPTESPPDDRGTPLCAGLVLPTGAFSSPAARWPETETALSHLDSAHVAERAISTLTLASSELSVPLFAPTLMAASGDELGAARHRKALRRGSASR